MCVVKLRWESSHTPRYFIVFAGLTVFSSLGMFVGINTEGPSSECLLQLYLVKWINSFLTWSTLSPHVVSQSWAAWNASSVIFVLVLRLCADAAMDPSSTYRVSGAWLAFPVCMRVLNSGSLSIFSLAPFEIASHMGAVKYATRIGDVHEPCGMPVETGLSLSHLPSRHIVAWRSCIKLCTHLTMGIGMLHLCSDSITSANLQS